MPLGKNTKTIETIKEEEVIPQEVLELKNFNNPVTKLPGEANNKEVVKPKEEEEVHLQMGNLHQQMQTSGAISVTGAPIILTFVSKIPIGWEVLNRIKRRLILLKITLTLIKTTKKMMKITLTAFMSSNQKTKSRFT